jgi:RimJ/RimL family protein N-acetyltransferase
MWLRGRRLTVHRRYRLGARFTLLQRLRRKVSIFFEPLSHPPSQRFIGLPPLAPDSSSGAIFWKIASDFTLGCRPHPQHREAFFVRTLVTNRLVIRRMSIDDAGFMLTLLNEPSWLRFIGDRGVRTIEEAKSYIQNGPVQMYASHGYGFCIVESKESACPMGICGLAKRNYLASPDIGFAFLPQHWGHGYAYESTIAVLNYAMNELGLKRLLATTRIDNVASQRVLEKLGFRFDQLIRHPDGDRDLKLYSTPDKRQG